MIDSKKNDFSHKMNHLERNLEYLKILSFCSKTNKNLIVKKGTKDLINTLNECAINTLNGNIRISNKNKSKLKRFKYPLRKLVRNKKISDKKKILIQEGGFLQYILPGAITLITTLIEHFLRK